MKRPQIPHNEELRLKLLREFEILDTHPEADFDDVTRIASRICGSNISLISLIDQDRQWIKSSYGIEASKADCSRDFSFCAHAINSPEEVFIVEDARADERFADNPLVTGDPYIRFYAGIPLVVDQGVAIGSLCLIDQEPKKLSQEQVEDLNSLSRMVTAHMRLRKRHNHYDQVKQVFANSSIGIALVSRENRAVVSNEALQKMLGYEADELVEMDFSKLTHEGDVERERQELEGLEEDRINHYHIEKRFIHKQGNVVWANVSVSIIQSDPRLPRYTVRMVKEISELKRTKEDLLVLNERLEDIVKERTSQLEETLLNLRESQDQLVASEKMAVLGQLIAGIAHEINTPISAISASSENLLDVQKSLLHRLSGIRDMLTEAEHTLFYDLVQASVIATAEVMSSREERQLRKSIGLALAEQALPNEDEVIDRLSDLRIEEITHHSALLRHEQNIELLTTAQHLVDIYRNASNIKFAASKCRSIITALKNFSRREQDQEEMSMVDVNTTLDLALALFQNQTKHNVELIKDFAERPLVNGHENQLSQVWTNLIQNGLQAMKFNGTLTVSTSVKDAHVMINISDTGPGIADNIGPDLFKPFFTTKEKGEGTGLGLDIAKKIITQHNGKIYYKSQPGATTFTVELPVLHARDVSAPIAAPAR